MRYAFIVLLLLLAGCASESPMVESDDVVVDTPPAEVDTSPAEVDTPPAEPAVKTFVLTGVNYRFFMDSVESPTLTVNEGDRVRVEFTSEEGFHDWVLDEFGAATEKVSEGSSTYVEFVADKKGDFEYYCSVGSHRANGMFGKFVVV